MVHTCILAVGGGEGRIPVSPFWQLLSSGLDTLSKDEEEEDLEEDDVNLCPTHLGPYTCAVPYIKYSICNYLMLTTWVDAIP